MGGWCRLTHARPTETDCAYENKKHRQHQYHHQVLFPGGETEGVARMRRYLARKQWVAAFEKVGGAGLVFLDFGVSVGGRL